MSLMTPDWAMVKKIKEYDPLLEVVWGRNHQRWIIVRNNPGGTRQRIMVVQNDDGSFRPLDERVLFYLNAHDLQKHGVDKFLQYLDKENSRVVNDLNARQKQRVEEITDRYYDKLRKEIKEDWGLSKHNFTNEQIRETEERIERTLADV